MRSRVIALAFCAAAGASAPAFAGIADCTTNPDGGSTSCDDHCTWDAPNLTMYCSNADLSGGLTTSSSDTTAYLTDGFGLGQDVWLFFGTRADSTTWCCEITDDYDSGVAGIERIWVTTGNGTDVIHADGYGGSDQFASYYVDNLSQTEPNVIYSTGSLGPDEVYGSDDSATFEEMHGSANDDYFVGNDGSDILHGNLGADTLEGGAGADEIFGSSPSGCTSSTTDGADIMYGGPGNDTMYGCYGNDVMEGGSGTTDILYGGYGDDQISGGIRSGANYCSTSDTSNTTDKIDPGPGADIAYGCNGSDVIRDESDSAADSLYGGAGVDNICALGADSYFGEADNDKLWSGSGTAATMDGGGGASNTCNPIGNCQGTQASRPTACTATDFP